MIDLLLRLVILYIITGWLLEMCYLTAQFIYKLNNPEEKAELKDCGKTIINFSMHRKLKKKKKKNGK